MMVHMFTRSAVIVGLLLLGFPAQAQELVLGHPDLLLIEGEIRPGAAAEFSALADANPQASTVILNSGGGRLNESMLIAEAVGLRGMDTVVLPDLVCNSGCVIVFAAGKNRAAMGKFGVHQVAGEGFNNAELQEELGRVAALLTREEVSLKVLVPMLRTPHNEIYYFSREELDEFGFNRGHVAWLDRKPP